MSNLREKMLKKTKAAVAESAAVVANWGNDGCMLYFYDPEKPEDMKNVDVKKVKDLFTK